MLVPALVRLLIAFAAALSAGGCRLHPPLVPVVPTQYGPVAGLQRGDGCVFLGIPYAAPPIGPLRWREPQPPTPWTGARSARYHGPRCPQPAGTDARAEPPPDEACLWLDVWSPQLRPDARLPVLVWLHGGAFRRGSAADPRYDGSALAHKGVVIVTVNSRTGLLGYFAHPALEHERPGGPANFGLLDAVAALHWVRSNIANFGGDPDRVTLGGDDSGATTILCLLGAPQARGTFQRAILQSADGWFEPMDRRTASSGAAHLLAAAGLTTSAATSDQLRALPIEQLAVLNPGAVAGPEFGPIADGHTVLAAPHELLRRGQWPAVPLLLGSTGDETGALAAHGLTPGSLFHDLGDAARELAALYPEDSDPEARATRMFADLRFAAPARWIAARHSPRAATWLYDLAVPAAPMAAAPVPSASVPAATVPAPAGAAGSGPAHGDDVLLLFGTLPLRADSAPRWMSERIVDYWLGFVRDGEPRASGSPEWPRAQPDAPAVLRLGALITVDAAPGSARLDAWDRWFSDRTATR